ncbi:MAG: AEC family transporter [Desulfuromonas sp.]|nr:MAG: AEC family transporter [Desulfuromonas sp.]
MALFVEILNIVLPVFIVIGLGTLLRRIGLIDINFVQHTNRLVYYLALPLLLFYKIGTANFSANFNIKLVVASIIGIALLFLISFGYARLRQYPAEVHGVFSQGSFRGNIAYVGLAIAMNAFGEVGLTRAGILMGFIVPFLNFFAIIALLLPHRGSGNHTGARFWLKQLILNPLILASAAGIIWSFLAIPLPLIAERSLQITTGMTLPLALIAIGGGFSLEKLKGDIVTTFLASTGKLIILPLITIVLLKIFGVTGMDYSIGILIAATPAATANYIMAAELNGDAELAGSIVMLSTLLSALTYTIILYLLRSGTL